MDMVRPMPVPEAPLQDDGHGRSAAGPGWFVVNLAETAGRRSERTGTYSDAEGSERFAEFGFGVHILWPGQPNGLYHEESNQEEFVVLSGECILIVEEQERRLGPWDHFHSPAGTRHILVGAGDGPCAILMAGSRKPDQTIFYPESEVAARHGASAAEATSLPREAYRDFPRAEPARFPWPPA
jgi:uncharacterized cupin superfamily protein